MMTMNLVDALDGLGHIEPHIGHTVSGHAQDCGQQQPLCDVSSTRLSQDIDTEQTSLEWVCH